MKLRKKNAKENRVTNGRRMRWTHNCDFTCCDSLSMFWIQQQKKMVYFLLVASHSFYCYLFVTRSAVCIARWIRMCPKVCKYVNGWYKMWNKMENCRQLFRQSIDRISIGERKLFVIVAVVNEERIFHLILPRRCFLGRIPFDLRYLFSVGQK